MKTKNFHNKYFVSWSCNEDIVPVSKIYTEQN